MGESEIYWRSRSKLSIWPTFQISNITNQWIQCSKSCKNAASYLNQNPINGQGHTSGFYLLCKDQRSLINNINILTLEEKQLDIWITCKPTILRWITTISKVKVIPYYLINVWEVKVHWWVTSVLSLLKECIYPLESSILFYLKEVIKLIKYLYWRSRSYLYFWSNYLGINIPSQWIQCSANAIFVDLFLYWKLVSHFIYDVILFISQKCVYP